MPLHVFLLQGLRINSRGRIESIEVPLARIALESTTPVALSGIIHSEVIAPVPEPGIARLCSNALLDVMRLHLVIAG